MNYVRALANPALVAQAQSDAIELARRMIVIGCAAALIFADKLLPF